MARVTTKKCGECGRKIDFRMIQRAQATEDDSTIIFAKSIAVALCPRCDAPDHRNTATPPPTHTG